MSGENVKSCEEFIDWLTVSQTFDENLPIVADRIGLHGDPQTFKFNEGVVSIDPKFISKVSVGHKGSFSSSLQVRCDGSKVTVSGNPSRFNCQDNLFGYASIDKCIDIYNHVLDRYGLPHFTDTTESHFLQSKTDKNSFVQNGAKISRIDITRNFATGSIDNGYKILRWLSGQRLNGLLGHLYPNGLTVAWLNHAAKTIASSSMNKYYGKFAELFEDAEPEYQKLLQGFVVENGVLRQEGTFRSRYLKRLGLDTLKGFREVCKMKLLNRFSPHLNSGGVGVSSYEKLYPELLKGGYSQQVSSTAQMILLSWASGQPIQSMFSKTKIYRYRAIILNFVGVDILTPMDVRFMGVRVETVEMKSLSMPDWYLQAVS